MSKGWSIERALETSIVSNQSKGALQLLSLIKEIFPNQKIVSEYHIGERLRLDYYLPRLALGFEYHGTQHFVYSEFFHGDRTGFLDSQKRDQRKRKLCEQLDITLIEVSYKDSLDIGFLRGKIMEALG